MSLANYVQEEVSMVN